MSIKIVQQMLTDAGFKPGPIDGAWGPATEAALRLALKLPGGVDSLAWGAAVSPQFRNKVRAISTYLGCDPNHLMACMAWESGETFSPKVVNMAGSGATGLIQFMPSTAKDMGVTTAFLASMTAEQQLDYVEEYFKPYRGKLKTLGDLYMAILWPKGVGKDDSYVLWDRTTRPTTYRQNSGIDINRDGVITKAEATAKVRAKLDKGMLPQYRWQA